MVRAAIRDVSRPRHARTAGGVDAEERADLVVEEGVVGEVDEDLRGGRGGAMRNLDRSLSRPRDPPSVKAPSNIPSKIAIDALRLLSLDRVSLAQLRSPKCSSAAIAN